jgi:AcrR family transcriptional regulator
MNKYEVRTQKKKTAIIEAALRLFREKGYTNTSINEIAALAGVSAVSIYNYFNSKEGLVKECAAMLLDETNQSVLALLSEKTGFREKLLHVVSLCAERPHELMEEYFSKAALNDKVFINLLQNGVNEIRMDILSAFIECGKEEGAINAAISTDSILEYLRAASTMQDKWETQKEYKEKSKELYQLILFGLIGR